MLLYRINFKITTAHSFHNHLTNFIPDPTATAARVLFFGFTFARVMHTVTYLNVMQVT